MIGLVLAHRGPRGADEPVASAPTRPTAPPSSEAPAPAPAPSATNSRIGTPSSAIDPDDFLQLDGHPLRWDACGPISWTLRRAGAPADAEATVTEAFRQLGAATGLTFVPGGPGDGLPPGPDLPPRTIAVAFARADEVPDLAGDVAGVGGPISSSEGVDDEPVVDGGFAIVDAGDDLRPGFDGGSSVGAVLLHELGHAVGLAHAPGPDRLMYESTSPGIDAAFQPGDLQVLAQAVAPGRCP